ncbi:hypothetical protein GC175_21625 [bacterium]|nr:hypothetical protein [bacterium]
MTEIIYEDQAKTYPIKIPADVLRDFCCHHHIRKLSFFCSILIAGFDAESDVDKRTISSTNSWVAAFSGARFSSSRK